MSKRNDVIGDYYAKNYNTLIKKVKGRVGNSLPHAEDIVQETFCRVLKYWKDDREILDLDAWVGTILRNTLRDYKTEEKRMGTTIEHGVEYEQVFEGAQLDQKTIREIQHLVGGKPGMAGEVLRLYFLSGYCLKEICQVVDVKYKTADQMIRRFRNDLKGRYDG